MSENKKILNIESQILDTEIECSLLSKLILISKEAGYTHVHDHWGHNAWDEYTIDEAIQKFSGLNSDDLSTRDEEGNLVVFGKPIIPEIDNSNPKLPIIEVFGEPLYIKDANDLIKKFK